MMNGMHMLNGMGWMGMTMMALFWIGIVVLVIWGLSALFPTRRQPIEQDALEMLKQRFARGEISREEFEQASAVLKAA